MKLAQKWLELFGGYEMVLLLARSGTRRKG